MRSRRPRVGVCDRQRWPRLHSSLYLFGGEGPDRMFMNMLMHSDMHELDLETKQWRLCKLPAGSQQPAPRCRHAAVSVGGRVIVHGGLSVGLESTRRGTMLRKRTDPHVVQKSASASVGLSEELKDVLNRCPSFRKRSPRALDVEPWPPGGDAYGFADADVWSFDPEGDCWEVIECSGSVPARRWGRSLAPMGSGRRNMFLYGGMTASGPDASLYHLTCVSPPR